jgi:hypothetical protein
VVRVLTREEQEARCRDRLAHLDAVATEWLAACGLLGEDCALERAELAKRRASLTDAMQAGRFDEMQASANAEVGWLAADRDRRQQRAHLQLAEAKARARRRFALAAQSVELAGGPHLGVPATRGQEEAHPLAAGTVVEHFEPGQPMTTEGSTPWDLALAELELAGGREELPAWAARHDEVQRTSTGAIRQMRHDTLLLELGRAVADRRWQARALADLAVLAARLATLAGEAVDPPLAAARQALEQRDAAAAKALLASLQEQLEHRARMHAVASRRQAVLAALAEAGYEVHEGMATAVVEGGRWVVRRAASPEMGVELQVAPRAEGLQLRPVRFAVPGEEGDTSRDRDIETLWCNDFQRMRQALGARDANLVIERALPVGAAPVAVVAEVPAERSRRQSTLRERQR